MRLVHIRPTPGLDSAPAVNRPAPGTGQGEAEKATEEGEMIFEPVSERNVRDGDNEETLPGVKENDRHYHFEGK